MKRILVSTVVLSGLFISNSFSNSDINLTNGLVAHYEFEDNVNDSSINNNNGISFGGINYIDGVIGKAVSLDGVDDYILVPNSISEEYSINFWISLEDISKHNSLLMLNNSTNWAFSDFWIFTSGSKLTALQNNEDLRYNNNLKIFEETNTLESNSTYFLSYNFKNEKLSIYLNNSLYAEYTNLDYLNSTVNLLSIGVSPNPTYDKGKYMLKGSMDDLRIYNRALNELEIEELYKLADLNNTICIQQIVYAQNPNTKTWIPFPSLCDVPNNWETNLTQPSDFNTSISSLNSEQIDNLEQGWHLLGTGYEINNLNIFNGVQTVWKYDKGWYGYSPNSDTQSLINNTANLKVLTNIEENKGFWINK